MKTELVVFDIDGLLINSEESGRKAWQEIADRYDLNLPTNFFYGIQDVGSEQKEKLLREFFWLAEHHDEATTNAAAYWKSHRESGADLLIEDGLLLLDYLSRNNIPIALVSSRNRSHMDEMIHDHFSGYTFAATVSGDEVFIGKPDPAMYLKVCAMVHARPSHTFVIEDSLYGIQSAYLANTKPIYVETTRAVDESIEKFCIGYFRKISDVIDYLKETSVIA